MTVTKAPLWLSARLNLALVGFLGCVVIYSLRTNLSVAIVCMVNQTAIAESAAQEATLFNQTKKVTEEQCLAPNGSVAEKKVNEDGEFIWSKTKQGQLLSAFFWGYPFSQILGGLLAGRFGGKMVLGSTVFGAAVITLLSPIAARTHVYALIVLRALLGFCQGVTFPCLHTMWSHWSPPLERSLLTGMTYAGAQIGNVLTLPVSGLLCKYGFDGGWPSVFYVLGVVALAWVVLWQVLIANSPSSHKRISAREREYIENSLAHEMKKEGTTHVPVPWRSVLTSLPVWAAVVGHFAGDWGAYMMMTSLPTFMNDVLKLDLTSLGFISSIPYIAYFFCINLGGFLADTVRKHNLLNTLNTRRVAMIIALGSQALFLVISGYCSCGEICHNYFTSATIWYPLL
uniref:Major facilitator superfamily (MFS) profile domain-containing protein n=1 Tax=Plectus sambesii TaxID=2011161 RepID=A0A914W490_9BILA